MKFNIILTILAAFFVFNLSAQNAFINDDITYSIECDQSSIPETDDFSYAVLFKPNANPDILGTQFTRFVKAFASVGGGTPFLLKDFGGNVMNGPITHVLGQSEFDGLPFEDISISFEITYFHTHNNPYENLLTVFENGMESASKIFTNTSDDPLVVTLSDVKCFTKIECDDVSLNLIHKNGWLTASINPEEGNYQTYWTTNAPPWVNFTTRGNSIKIPANSCYTYTFNLIDLDTGCKYSRSKIVCTSTSGGLGDGLQNDDSENNIDTRSGENVQEITMEIYPNPSSSFINIEVNNLTGQEAIISVTNMQGQQVFKTIKPIQSGSINYTWNPNSQLENGVYIVNIFDNNTVYNKRVVFLK